MTPTVRENNNAIFMLRMAEILHIQPSEEQFYTIGMIEDMLTERGNDNEKYNKQATQDYFDRF